MIIIGKKKILNLVYFFQHPSHSLLKENGFTQLQYTKYHSRCLKGTDKGFNFPNDDHNEDLDWRAITTYNYGDVFVIFVLIFFFLGGGLLMARTGEPAKFFPAPAPRFCSSGSGSSFFSTGSGSKRPKTCGPLRLRLWLFTYLVKYFFPHKQ